MEKVPVQRKEENKNKLNGFCGLLSVAQKRSKNASYLIRCQSSMAHLKSETTRSVVIEPGSKDGEEATLYLRHLIKRVLIFFKFSIRILF